MKNNKTDRFTRRGNDRRENQRGVMNAIYYLYLVYARRR